MGQNRQGLFGSSHPMRYPSLSSEKLNYAEAKVFVLFDYESTWEIWLLGLQPLIKMNESREHGSQGFSLPALQC